MHRRGSVHRARRFDRATALIATTSAQARAAHDEAALGALESLNASAALESRDADAARTHALAARAPETYIDAALALSRLAEHVNDDTTAYGTLASGWATVSDLLGADLARAAFEPLLREQRLCWGAGRFDAARTAYEATRRAQT